MFVCKILHGDKIIPCLRKANWNYHGDNLGSEPFRITDNLTSEAIRSRSKR